VVNDDNQGGRTNDRVKKGVHCTRGSTRPKGGLKSKRLRRISKVLKEEEFLWWGERPSTKVFKRKRQRDAFGRRER